MCVKAEFFAEKFMKLHYFCHYFDADYKEVCVHVG